MPDQTLLILNGPGLAGGHDDVALDQVRQACATLCDELGIGLDFRQTDDDDEMSGWIAEDAANCSALIINPHVASQSDAVDIDKVHAAIETLDVPVVEVHLTNIFKDGSEPPRLLQGPDGESGFVCGMSIHGYLLGIKAVASRLQS